MDTERCPQRIVERVAPYAAILQAALIVPAIVSLFLAARQLATNNAQTKTAYTLDFLARFEDREFEQSYRNGIEWLAHKHDTPLQDPGLANDITWVLDSIDTLGKLYLDGVLDEQLVEATIGIKILQFYEMVKVGRPEFLRGYKTIPAFCSVLKERFSQS